MDIPGVALLGEDDGVPDPVLKVSLRPLVDDLLNEGDDVLLPLQLFLENHKELNEQDPA